MMMDMSSLLLRDFSDLTRPELIARRKKVEVLRVNVLHTREHISPRKQLSFVVAIAVLIVGYALTHFLLLAGVAGRTNYRPALFHSAAELAHAAGWRNTKTGATATISASPVGLHL